SSPWRSSAGSSGVPPSVTGRQSGTAKPADRPATLASVHIARQVSNERNLLRTTTRSLAVIASLLLVLTLSSVAAGATRNASPKKWVSVFCGSVVTWEKSVKTDRANLDKTLAALDSAGRSDVPALEKKLVGFLAGVVHSTDTMLGKIRAVGPPDVKNGGKIQSGVLDAFKQLRKAFQDAKVTAQKLPTGNAKTFSTRAAALGLTVQSS